MIKLISSLVILGLLTSCGISNIDKPPPTDYQKWKKAGASELEIQKALLECGSSRVFGWVLRNKHGDIVKSEFNEYLLASRCMQRNGFYVQEKNSYCSYRPWKEKYSACQPDAVIPTRSVERRLNSLDCQNFPKAEACQP